ncbi:KOW domain-containing RNA-binding protein [Hominifimenecus sp. rT4P-3]|uniref:KOW domain-containing RNA-binding protein n=1 Tax=Hominifimenecus sp. rT4P-3 TaxID=3242979 RepID=UPI003DA4ADE6
MDCYSAGNFVRSLAGHDKESVFIIIREEGSFVFVADGRLRSIKQPKRKNKKHVQPIRRKQDGELLRSDEAVKKAIQSYIKESRECPKAT